MTKPIAHRMPLRLRERLLSASATHDMDSGDIARRALRKFFKQSDIRGGNFKLYDKGDDKTERTSFRLDDYIVQDIKQTGHKMSDILNVALDWYLTLDEEAAKCRIPVKPFIPPNVVYTVEEEE